MKTLFGILVGVFVCASVQAQAPFLRNAFTTNATPVRDITLTGTNGGNSYATRKTTATIGAGTNLYDVGMRLTRSGNTYSALDIEGIEAGGKAWRYFLTLGGTRTQMAYLADNGILYNVGLIASGTFSNYLVNNGEDARIEPPSLDPLMIGVWSDVIGGLQVRAANLANSWVFEGLNFDGTKTSSIQPDGSYWFGSATNHAGLDTGIRRVSAGLLEINSTTNGDYRDLNLRTLKLITPGPSTVTVQLTNSPYLYFNGGLWSTVGGTNIPISARLGGLASASGMGFEIAVNQTVGGPYSGAFTMTPGGSVTLLGNLDVAPAGAMGFAGRSRLFSSANGAMQVNNNAASALSTLQFNTPQVTKTSNYTIAAALDSGLEINNIGASGPITNTLPTAVANQHYWAYVDAAQILSVKASGSDVIRWGSTVSAAAGDIWSSQVGSKFHIRSPKAGLWVVDGDVGAWTLAAPRLGNVALVSGVAIVTNSTVTANSAVFLQRKTSGGTIGMSITYTLNAGTSFTITSDNVLDTSTYTWKLEEIPN